MVGLGRGLCSQLFWEVLVSKPPTPRADLAPTVAECAQLPPGPADLPRA